MSTSPKIYKTSVPSDKKAFRVVHAQPPDEKVNMPQYELNLAAMRTVFDNCTLVSVEMDDVCADSFEDGDSLERGTIIASFKLAPLDEILCVRLDCGNGESRERRESIYFAGVDGKDVWEFAYNSRLDAYKANFMALTLREVFHRDRFTTAKPTVYGALMISNTREKMGIAGQEKVILAELHERLMDVAIAQVESVD